MRGSRDSPLRGLPLHLALYAIVMKIIGILFIFFSLQSHGASDQEACMEFVGKEENYKIAHENSNCIAAAEQGSGAAMYSIGLGYGYAGNKGLETVYYHLAAGKKNPAAYLALGHKNRETNQENAIAWYTRFYQSKVEGYGYAALLLSQIFESQGNTRESEHWLSLCNQSPLGPKCSE